MKELKQRRIQHRIGAKRIWKGQHHLSILYLGGDLPFYRTQRYVSDWGVDFTGTFICQNSLKGTSLVVQWLRACQPTQGTQVWSLVWEDSTCHRTTKSGYHNYWPWTLEAPSYNCWAHRSSGRFFETGEATTVRSPCTAAGEEPRFATIREGLRAAMKTQGSHK